MLWYSSQYRDWDVTNGSVAQEVRFPPPQVHKLGSASPRKSRTWEYYICWWIMDPANTTIAYPLSCLVLIMGSSMHWSDVGGGLALKP